MLAARDLCVTRGSHRALDGVSLELRPGEILAVLGPNGAGKSTLLHALAGSLRPGAGTVTLDGRSLHDWPRAELARRRAVLPQAPSLTFPFRVHEVVLLGRGPHAGHSTRHEDLATAAAAMARADAAVLSDRVYTTLSGGERQRVHLARVMAQIWPAEGNGAPDRYLLLDEPTNNLDLAHQRTLMHGARSLARRGVGVLAILHDPNTAALHADRIAVLRGGGLAACGTPEEVITGDVIEATYGLRVTVMRHPEYGRPCVMPV